MYYTYVMGMNNSILELKEQEFHIEKDENDENNYKVSFPKAKAKVWEEFIKNHLEVNYWNEYLAEDKVIFIFHLEDGFRKYEVTDYINDEVLSLCEELCKRKFESIKKMLSDNAFYKNVIQ